MRQIAGRGIRFVIAGGANTLATGLLLSLLAHFINPSLAYTIVFVLGIALSTVLADRFVFRVRMTKRQVIQYIVLYVVVYLIGMVAIRIAQTQGLPDAYSGLVVLITAPLTFVGANFLLKPKSSAEDGSSPQPSQVHEGNSPT